MTNGGAGKPPAIRRTISFCGPIYQNATRMLRNVCCQAVNDRVDELTILFSSDGGSIDDGFALYGFLLALPLELTIHNVGLVGSIANAVFLAGEKRYASPHAVFFFHDLHWRYAEAQNLKSTTMEEHSLLMDSARSRLQALFNLHAKNGNPLFNNPQFFKEAAVHDAATAKATAIIHDIKDASISANVLNDTLVLNVDWQRYVVCHLRRKPANNNKPRRSVLGMRLEMAFAYRVRVVR
jgi:ATP-dependent Clp protease, protease subunit